MRGLLILLPGVIAAAVPAFAAGADLREQEAVLEYATCVATRAPESVRRAVLEGWSGRQMAAEDLLGKDVCVRKGARMTFAPDVIRGAMAQALVARELRSQDAARVASAPPLAYGQPLPLRTHDDKGRPMSAASLQRQKDAIAAKTSFVAVSQFGECLARANPPAVAALVVSQPGSDAERAAVEALRPNMPPCVPRGVTLEIDKPRLRNSAAIAYYRLAMAARGLRGGVPAQ